MKVIYVNNLKDKVQQGLSTNIDKLKGTLKIGSSLDETLLWSDIPKTKIQREVVAIEIDDGYIFAAISGPNCASLKS